jgi:hypothetical protein
MWFEVAAPDAHRLSPEPEAFALAALPVAAWLAEPRLRVEGRLCGTLARGLEAAGETFARWHPRVRPVPVEASDGFATLSPRAEPLAAAFLSGGVDSLSLVASGVSDPLRPTRLGIFLFGWHGDELEDGEARPRRLRAHEAQRRRLEAWAGRLGVSLVSVSSNVRAFHPHFDMSMQVGFGAGMVSAAHALRGSLSSAALASGGYPGPMPPHGSHPDLDRLFSSSAVEVVHGEAGRTRLDKVRSLATTPGVEDVLQVCLQREVLPEGVPNCGDCEKCVRTRLAFLAVGRSDVAERLGPTPLDPDRVARLRVRGEFRLGFAREVRGALAAAGERRLSRALDRAVRAGERHGRRRALARRVCARLRGLLRASGPTRAEACPGGRGAARARCGERSPPRGGRS